MDNFAIRERLTELKKETAEIRAADLQFLRSRSSHPLHVKKHEDRVIRMKQILEEIELLKKPGGRNL